MGTPKNVAEELVAGIADVRIRAMMGEWIVYFREKMVGTIENGHLFVTPVPAARAMLPEADMLSPHAGAKPRLLVENASDKAFLYALFAAMWEELPARNRSKKKNGGQCLPFFTGYDMKEEKLAALRAREKEGRDPTCADETLAFMLKTAREIGAERILEIGAGKGLTSIAFALALPDAHVAAIERDAERIAAARENFAAFGVSERVRLIEGDAAEILPCMEGAYDLIFLDAAKVQYRRFLPDCKRLLKEGGVLFSDDVLLFEEGVPKKRKMLAAHIAEYLGLLSSDADLSTEILRLGMGLAVSRKVKA